MLKILVLKNLEMMIIGFPSLVFKTLQMKMESNRRRD